MDYNEFIRARASAFNAFLRNRPALPVTILGAANGGIPVSSSVAPGSNFYEETIATSTGILNVQQPYSSLIGRLNDAVEKQTIRVYDLPGSIAYKQTELEVGNAVEILRVGFNNLFTAVEHNMARFAIQGAPELQIYGVRSHPKASEYIIENNGTGSSAAWSAKTPALIYQDVIKFLTFAENQALPYPITHLLLGGDVSTRLQGTIYSADGSLFLNQVLVNNINSRINPPRIVTIPELKGMVAFSSSRVSFELVEEFHPIEHSMEGAKFLLVAGVTVGGVSMASTGAISFATVQL